MKPDCHIKVFTDTKQATSGLPFLCGKDSGFYRYISLNATDEAAVERTRARVEAGKVDDVLLCPACCAGFLANYRSEEAGI